MRSPSAPAEVLSGVAGWRPVVSSWLGTRNLAADVPVLSGRVTATVEQAVPEKLTLRVPRWSDERDWLPGGDPQHPLARFGQELAVSIVVSSSASPMEWETRVGRFLITEWQEESDGAVSVTAFGLLRRAETDLLPSPVAPRAGGTFVSEFRRLLPRGLSAGFHADLVDRACPRGMEWAEDRLGALYEIADAWPARLRTDAWGQVQLLPPLPDVPTPVVTLTDGERGTLVGAPRSDTQEGAPNRIVARSSASGRESVQAVVDLRSGPMRVGGDYPTVAEVFASPLIRTAGEAVAAGRTVLARKSLPSRTLPVTCAPDPRLDLYDAVAVVSDGVTEWGWVTGYDLPLTVDDGPMRVDVGVSA